MQITDELWLCPHASWGRSSVMLGAVEEGRRLLERAGGYDAVLAKIVAAEEEKREARRRARMDQVARGVGGVRYG